MIRRHVIHEDDGPWMIEYDLTPLEEVCVAVAYILKWCFGGCLADYYSAELESKLCGTSEEHYDYLYPIE